VAELAADAYDAYPDIFVADSPKASEDERYG